MQWVILLSIKEGNFRDLMKVIGRIRTGGYKMRFIKKGIIILVVVIISFFHNNSAFTQDNEAIIDFGDITNLYNQWHITFNEDIDINSISKSSISIIDGEGESIPIRVGVKNDKVIVIPLASYKNYVKYTLILPNRINNINGISLSKNNKSNKVIFFTKAVNENGHYSTPVEYMSKISPLYEQLYNGQALVTLSYDDSYRNWYYYALPLHSKYNMPGTFNIIGDKVYSGDEYYLNSSEIWVAHDLGIEIASHTQTHPFLTNKTESEIRQEFETSSLILEDLVGEVSILAIPYSFYNDQIREIAMDYFDGVRVYDNDTNRLDNYDPYWLKSFAIVNTMEFSTIKGWIDQAIEEKSWVIIMLHGITDERLEEYETTPKILEQIMQYINNQGKDNILPVNTKEGLQLMKGEQQKK